MTCSDRSRRPNLQCDGLSPTINYQISTMHIGRLLVATLFALLAAAGALEPVCYTSNLGFQCQLQVCKGMYLHWTIGGDGPDPSTCSYTPAMTPGVNATESADAPVVHFALHSLSPNQGWVGMSFPQRGGEMYPADAVIGYTLGQEGASIKPYHLTGESVGLGDVDSEVVLFNEGAQLVAAPGDSGLTVCFSRTVAEVGGAGQQLKLDGMVMNFAAASRQVVGGVMHEHDKDCNTRISLLAVAAGGVQGAPGGNMGSDDSHEGRGGDSARAHGALMVIAWAVLVPAGLLAARHRALFKDTAETKRWFKTHAGLQFAAIVFTTISLYIIVSRGGLDVDDWRGLMRAHGGIGITLIVLLLLHLLGTALRPQPSAPRRPMWNILHHWNGRIMFIFAFVQLMTGPKLFGERAPFYVPTFLMLSIWLVVAVVLEIKQRGQGAGSLGGHHSSSDVEDRYAPAATPSSGGDADRRAGTHQPKSDGEGLQMQMLPTSMARSA